MLAITKDITPNHIDAATIHSFIINLITCLFILYSLQNKRWTVPNTDKYKSVLNTAHLSAGI
jgi:hypothetical protein